MSPSSSPVARLETWFQAAARSMPWRLTRDPYCIWVSEVMLQQTQVATVIPYYERFLARFPTVNALAAAPLEDVLVLWKGLGYYARARNLHRGAQFVASSLGGVMPDTLEGLLAVPGIGRYTAGALLSIGFNKPAPILDGNVARVLSRWYGLEDDPRSSSGLAARWALAETLVQQGTPRVINQALMELGALVCTPASPRCTECPVLEGCVASTLPDPSVLPMKPQRKERPTREIVSLWIVDEGGRFLMAHRPTEGLLGDLWELPSGLLEPGEAPSEGAARLIGFRLGGAGRGVEAGRLFEHTFTHFHLRAWLVRVQLTDANLEPSPARLPKSGGRGRTHDPLEPPYQALRWCSRAEAAALPVGRVTTLQLEAMALGEVPGSQLELPGLARRPGRTRRSS